MLNANDPPTDISVNQTSFPENLEIGSFIAELSATDSEINRGFEVISGRFNWDQANEDAQSKGGHLATFSSEEEWNEALEAISGTENGQHIWIGASDTEKRETENGLLANHGLGQIGVKLAIQNLMAVHVRTGVSLNSVTPIPGTI